VIKIVNSGYYFLKIGMKYSSGKIKKEFIITVIQMRSLKYMNTKDKFVNKSFLVKYKNEIIDFDFERLCRKKSFIDFSSKKSILHNGENYKRIK
jgi:hypothetical protein